MATVWVVGQVKAGDWELGGVFTSSAAAAAVCIEPNDGYWPVELDTFLGRNTWVINDVATWPARSPTPASSVPAEGVP